MDLREMCNYKSFNKFDSSEPPEELNIRLFDKQGECYKELTRQRICGHVYGNLAGDINELRNRIIEITPQLKEFLREGVKEEPKSGFSFFGLFKKK